MQVGLTLRLVSQHTVGVLKLHGTQLRPVEEHEADGWKAARGMTMGDDQKEILQKKARSEFPDSVVFRDQ